jgi:prepilin-type processing-associated H-X9-DG protein
MQDDRPTIGDAPSLAASRPRRRPQMIIAVVLLIVFAAIYAGLIGIHHFKEYAGRINCANNMRQIALAAIMYANSHGNQYPDDLPTLFDTEDLGSGVWHCTSSDSNELTTATSREARDAIAAGHISYVWVGKDVTVTSPDDTVILYELPDNHDGYGMNVAFADAHIEWFNAKQMKALLDKIATGERPVRVNWNPNPATQP